MKRFNSQTLILIGATLFVLYLAGVPLVMLLYGSIRSAPIGEPGATYTTEIPCPPSARASDCPNAISPALLAP